MGASVWMTTGIEKADHGLAALRCSVRPMALTMPVVMVPSSPKGLPIAMASCPP